MNVDKWIEENSTEVEWPQEHFNYDLEVAIRVSDLRELLKTHAIVPRDPSDDILEKLLTMNSVKARYKAMIKAAEQE
ncbi:hypothetical protein I3271_05510 [Photobacterium leiognathi]|uniref:hypothetical protein n=1 Tax=Photobacterium leiognathi TaxID=553611 RepID=UPI001EDCB477|nr:hypothetical protein [Photobacterium leiognathi]MCG3884138.1 hypothetical protein [Photobacterium leiognathi]